MFFLDEKNGSGKICLQLFFDQCLVTFNLQEDLKNFYNRCMAVKDNSGFITNFKEIHVMLPVMTVYLWF